MLSLFLQHQHHQQMRKMQSWASLQTHFSQKPQGWDPAIWFSKVSRTFSGSLKCENHALEDYLPTLFIVITCRAFRMTDSIGPWCGLFIWIFKNSPGDLMCSNVENLCLREFADSGSSQVGATMPSPDQSPCFSSIWLWRLSLR